MVRGLTGCYNQIFVGNIIIILVEIHDTSINYIIEKYG